MTYGDVSTAYGDAFRRFAGLAPATRTPPDLLPAFIRREPGTAFCVDVERAVRHCGDRDLGFRFGAAIGGRGMGLLGVAVATAPTLGCSLASLARWQPLVGTLGRMRAERLGAFVRVRWEAPLNLPSALAEGVVSGWIAIARLLTGEVLPIRCLELAHGRGLPSEGESILGCPVRFGRGINAVTVPTEIFDAHSRYADASMHATLSGWFDECLGVLGGHGSALLRRAGEAIVLELAHGGQLEQRVCAHLGLALRTLQRRCSDSGVAFRRLRDLLRANLAVCGLAQDDARCGHIAQRLGFEEQASFSRAVRQWTGRSPREVARLFAGDYRAGLRGA